MGELISLNNKIKVNSINELCIDKKYRESVISLTEEIVSTLKVDSVYFGSKDINNSGTLSLLLIDNEKYNEELRGADYQTNNIVNKQFTSNIIDAEIVVLTEQEYIKALQIEVSPLCSIMSSYALIYSVYSYSKLAEKHRQIAGLLIEKHCTRATPLIVELNKYLEYHIKSLMVSKCMISDKVVQSALDLRQLIMVLSVLLNNYDIIADYHNNIDSFSEESFTAKEFYTRVVDYALRLDSFV